MSLFVLETGLLLISDMINKLANRKYQALDRTVSLLLTLYCGTRWIWWTLLPFDLQLNADVRYDCGS